ncbi:unnamed protein product [Linum trigynum]|uniref:F-box domain-containing protein n=1 Tax=Linum trigynum TaxID=586398 RepID=A0AAV2DI08_9ROSI
MMNHPKKAGERRSDRLSALPEAIIGHILSFLDTKSAVQTSVLSRALQSAWKQVPVINLHSNSFKEYRNFRSFVSKVLSLRCNVNVQKLRYIDHDHSYEDRDVSLFVEVIKYALSHNTQHLVIDLENGTDYYQDCYKYSDLFGSVLDSNLTTLELRSVIVDSGFRSSGFRVLTTLCLRGCLLVSDSEVDIDLFSNLPCLENLVLRHCPLDHRYPIADERIVNITGPELLSLTVDDSWFPKIEITAPKLQFFIFWHTSLLQKFSKLSLPSVVHADINDCIGGYGEGEEQMALQLISLFQGVSNAKSLVLDAYGIEELNKIFEFLEKHPSPFTRLESLMVDIDTTTMSIPLKLVNYLFKRSSCTNPKIEFAER